jgi:tight adherence protein B
MIDDPQLLAYGVYFMVVTTVILVVEAVYLTVRARRSYSGAINHRLGKLGKNSNPEAVLIDLRKERGLDDAGNYKYALVALGRLFLQSGTKGDPLAFLGSFLVVGLGVGVSAFLFNRSILTAVFSTLVIGIALPVLVLWRRRAGRIKRFAEQLPESLDIIVRSLRAGHPTPVALALVAREMPDPIGSEFGIVCDEMTYGLELERAMRNLLERVGLDDLRLVAVSMGIQASTGGNLAEILANLAQVVRDRFKLRRKIKAVSAEGRWSAILISIFPFVLFGIIALIAPNYYGGVWHEPIVQPVLGFLVLWMMFGDYIMYRMVNFDF